MPEALDVLAVFAHPDDAELLCGGALARAVDDGQRVGILDLTRGELGSRGTPEIRAREADRAAEILGVSVRRNAGLPDGHVQSDLDSRRVVAGFLRELRPTVIVTHWIHGRHPDHRITAELAYDACFLAGLRNFAAPGEPHRPRTVVHATAFREDADPPSFVIDVTGQIERKIAAIAAYESQFEGVIQAGEVFPAGERHLPDQIHSRMAAYGSLIRAAFGEPFRIRETLEWPGLGVPTTATF